MHTAQIATATSAVEVTLEKQPPRRLGAMVDHNASRGTAAEVGCLHDQGAIAGHNRANPQAAITTGDLIVQANEVRGSGLEIVKEIMNADSVKLHLERLF